MKMILAVMMATLTAAGLVGCSKPVEPHYTPAKFNLKGYEYVHSRNCRYTHLNKQFTHLNIVTGNVEVDGRVYWYTCPEPVGEVEILAEPQ